MPVAPAFLIVCVSDRGTPSKKGKIPRSPYLDLLGKHLAFSRLSFARNAVLDLRTPPESQIPALDALRTLAILMVIAGHFPVLGQAQFPQYKQLLDGPLFAFGWTGVDLFFVLSGFLIGRQLWKELQRTGTVNVGRFITRRGFRIWPLYFFIAIIAPALDDKWSYKWPDWAFISNYFYGRVEGGWSLSTEEQFYILAPLLVFACARFMRVRGWFTVLPLMLVAVAGSRWWTARALFSAGDTVEKVKTAMYSPFHLHNEGLVIGLLIALVSVVSPRVFDGSSASRLRVCAVAALACIVAVALRASNGVVFPFLSLALIYGSLTVALLALGTSRLAPLRARIFYRSSRLSYGMYLNHLAVLRWIAPSVARFAKGIGGQNPFTLVTTLVAVVAISASFAVVTFIAIEHPFLALRARLQLTKASTEHRSSTRPRAVAPAGAYPFGDLAVVERAGEPIGRGLERDAGVSDVTPLAALQPTARLSLSPSAPGSSDQSSTTSA